ncbi:restriction endonuclease subunit S [Micromonospora sp. NPDC005172]|uniref:restriction endonuclease subunit S n=1 Tax=Micromonospora sp. NPDC005172 TaxID=3156867 RepID=UPI0033A8ADB1
MSATYNYPQVPLRRFIQEITDGPFGSSLTSSHYSDEGARVIRLGNIGAAHFRNTDAAYIPFDHYRQLLRHQVLPGDLLIAGLGDERHPVGRSCVAPENIGPAIVKADCFRARLDETRLTHRFAAWALSSSFVTDQVVALARGSTRSRINLDVARDVGLPVPPLQEQRRIANFLDAETSHIDALVEKHRQQSEFLTQSETSVIAELLELAEGNSPTRVKHLANRITSGPRGWGELVVDKGPQASLFLRITNIPRRGIELNLSAPLYVAPPSGQERERSRTEVGDVLVSITADIGSVAVVDARAAGGNVSQHLALIRPNGDICNSTWLAYAIKSSRSKQTLLMSSYGGTKVGLGLADVANLSVMTPNLRTQERLAVEIGGNLALRNDLQQQVIRKISLLAERRRALITAAVTGQIDVSTASGRGICD